jgi:hypothetical protein
LIIFLIASAINATTKQKTKVERKRITKYKKQKRNNRFYGHGVAEYHPSAGNHCIKHFTPNNTSLYFFYLITASSMINIKILLFSSIYFSP